MRYNIFIIILIHSFIWSQPNMQPKKVTEKFFREYEELEEVTPGLQKNAVTLTMTNLYPF